ncbi:MAG: type I restriction enzyme endonuclease domain-containing protein, partial [Candidatus Macondimonas sp.]
VVSQGQNEVEDLKAKGLDIVPHRQRLLKEALDEKFKDEADPLRLVFVCAMWITGFDVPTCSTMYLDKPMRAHTLMQTIARANRVAPGKESGLIVDYVGIFRALQNALATYARPSADGVREGGHESGPILDKAELVAALQEALNEAAAFAQVRGVTLETIAAAQGFVRIGLIDDAVEALLASEAEKKHYLQLASRVARLFKAILPDAAANALAPLAVLVAYLAAKIQALGEPPDISAVMSDVEALLNDSIATEGYHIGPASRPEALVNLSEIDFAALQARFAQGHKRTEAEKLKRLIEGRLAQMLAVNGSRIDLADKFQQLIDEYNAGSRNVEEFFDELKDFVAALTAEEQRGIAEGLSEEELALFDILTKPEPVLTKAEEAEVKKVCRELLATLKREKLVLDWREKQQAKAAVMLTMKVEMRRLPAQYTKDVRAEKMARAYAHVYDHYAGGGQSAV